MAVRLQFVCEAAWQSRAIAWFSSGHFSHVDAVWEYEVAHALEPALLGSRDDYSGGQPRGVWVRPQFYRKWVRRVVFEIACDTFKEARWREFLRSQIGKPYDERAIWGFVVNRNWRESDSWICSELQARALEAAEIVPPLYLAANKITPVALALAISAAGAKVIESVNP